MVSMLLIPRRKKCWDKLCKNLMTLVGYHVKDSVELWHACLGLDWVTAARAHYHQTAQSGPQQW